MAPATTTNPKSQVEGNRKQLVPVSCRIPIEWEVKLLAMAGTMGKHKADLMREAIGQFIGEEMPQVMSELLEIKLMATDVAAQNKKLLEQNINLHRRLQALESKFKTLAS